MSLSVVALVQVLLHAVVDKSHNGKRNNDPAAIARLALPLQKRIRHAISDAQRTASTKDINWETQLITPLIGDSCIAEDLGVSKQDEEYVVLLTSVIILAYELLLHSALEDDHSYKTSLAEMFEKYLCEPVVSCQLIAQLKVEQSRLERAGADFSVQRAVQDLLDLVPDTVTRSSAWTGQVPTAQDQGGMEPLCVDTVVPKLARTSLDTLARYPRNLRVEIFLKPGCSWDFDFVESVQLSDGVLVVKTCVGLCMHVEPGFIVSEVAGAFDSLTVKAPLGCETAFAATIIVPPGYSFYLIEVEHVSELEGVLAQTMIETSRAVLNVSNDNFTIKRRNHHRSVLVESTEC
jgi:hypothetical protein